MVQPVVQVVCMLARVVLAVLLCLPLSAQARDRAVLVYPREHSLFRRVFYTGHQRMVRAALGTRFDLEVHDQIATADALFDLDVDGAKLLVLSAHGDPFSMRFAGTNDRTLDASDRARLATFLSRLAPDATIILQSCSTGQGFAHVVKEAAGPGRRVIAARGVIPRDGLAVTSLYPLEVRMRCEDRGKPWDCTVRLGS
jgi:hypothetical protein